MIGRTRNGSGTTITTTRDSSAVVSLGRLGRAEVLPFSSISLGFDGNGIGGMLLRGVWQRIEHAQQVNISSSRKAPTCRDV